MPESDPQFYERAIRRISWLTLGLGLLGSIATVSLRGFWSGLAFLIGAAVSYLSFFGWRRLAGAMGPVPTRDLPGFFRCSQLHPF